MGLSAVCRFFVSRRGWLASAVALGVAGTVLGSAGHAQSASQPTVRSLNLRGLNYETELTALFLGDFDNARVERDGLRFLSILNGYIDAYSRQCAQYLPRNRVEITERVCASETVTRNGWGVEVSRYCSQWVDRGTGRYADPRFWGLSKRIERDMTPGLMRDMIGLDGQGSIASSRQMADIALTLGDDMSNMLENNACNGPGVVRLQENFLRFGDNQSGLRLSGRETLASVTGQGASGVAFTDSDYSSLIDDLIAENAKGWMINRYVPGSTSATTVQGRDSQGRPSRLQSSYRFSGLSGPASGSVQVTFENGLPNCIYFSDAPQVCRLPSRRIITAYERGEYR